MSDDARVHTELHLKSMMPAPAGWHFLQWDGDRDGEVYIERFPIICWGIATVRNFGNNKPFPSPVAIYVGDTGELEVASPYANTSYLGISAPGKEHHPWWLEKAEALSRVSRREKT